MNDFEQKIRNICTYHGDGGTSGYNLSEEQFQRIFDLFEDYKKELGEIVENMETDINDVHYVQGFEDALNKVSSLLQKDKENKE